MRKLLKCLALVLCGLAATAGMYLFSWRGFALVLLAESAFAVWVGIEQAEREEGLAEEFMRTLLEVLRDEADEVDQREGTAAGRRR